MVQKFLQDTVSPQQNLFDEYEDKQIKLSKKYMPGINVNVVMQKNYITNP